MSAESAPKQTPHQESFPAIEIKNKVVWVNEELHAPFALNQGEKSDFGLLLALSDRQEKNSVRELGVRSGHYRTGDIGKVVFSDNKGRRYRDVDLKGSGLLAGDNQAIFGSKEPLKPKQWYSAIHKDFDFGYYMTDDVRGLMNESDARHDAAIAERFTKLGMRTHRVLGIVQLKELNTAEGLKSVDNFKKSGKLVETFNPVIEVRAFGTKNRINELLSENSNKELVEDALSWLEIDFKQARLSIPQYMVWFAETLGKNVGILHKNKFVHRYLNPQNITLDCRIVDFDSVAEFPENLSEERKIELYLNDAVGEAQIINRPGAWRSLRMFSNAIARLYPETKEAVSKEVLKLRFEEAYLREFPEAKSFLDLEKGDPGDRYE